VIIHKKNEEGEFVMNLTQEQRDLVATEIKKFASELNLSEEQKTKFHAFLTDSYTKVQEYKSQNPTATKEDIIQKVAANRTQLRERLVNFLTPEQLQKWDAGVARAKEFLGHKIAA
jgi:periplasmic protein CpxP/Spy